MPEAKSDDRLATAYFSNFWDEGVPDFMPKIGPVADRYDAIVVGAGYSGLAVASGLARNGLSVLVLEAETVGYGASSRNGGMVGPSFHELGTVGLTKKYGEEKAREILRAGIDALDYCQDLFSSDDIDCDFVMSGRFRGARSDVQLADMAAECARLEKAVGLKYKIVSPSEQAFHTGSQAYRGGVLYTRDGGLHPKRLVNSLARQAEKNGAQIRTHSPVTGIDRSGNAFRVTTPSEVFVAEQVIVATDGYSDHGVRVMHARIVPIDVSVCATRQLTEEQLRELSPRLHMQGETGRVFIWSRPTPDRSRFIFGGRISSRTAPVQVQQQQIARAVQRIYPQLRHEDFEQIWHGKVGYTTDHTPHLNKIDGIWLIGGYCGSGVTRSLFFAEKLVRKITGQSDAATPFDDLEFPRVPLRFLAPMGAKMLTKYYGWLDRQEV